MESEKENKMKVKKFQIYKKDIKHLAVENKPKYSKGCKLETSQKLTIIAGLNFIYWVINQGA